MDKTLYSAESLRLATWLKQQRHAKGLTMRQLAEIIKEPHSYIGKIEQGLRRLDVVELVWYCQWAPLITLILRHFSQKINFRLKNTHSYCHSVQFLPVLADFGQNNPLVTHTH